MLELQALDIQNCDPTKPTNQSQVDPVKPLIAIQPDITTHHNGVAHSFAQRWIELCEDRGWGYEIVDARSNAFIESIGKYNAFLWRLSPTKADRELMKHLASLFESYSDVVVYPSSRTLFSSSKIEQLYVLNLRGIPIPNTRIFYKEDEALTFIEEAEYPFVLKLDNSSQSRSVALVDDKIKARKAVKLLFSQGMETISSIDGRYRPSSSPSSLLKHKLKPAAKALLGYPFHEIIWHEATNYGYIYAQEYIENNDFDTRITIVGEHAFGFRRFNRENDFRASGSGSIDWNPEAVDPDIVKLAFQIAESLGTQTNAMDFIYKNEKPVLLECNLSFPAWGIAACPGYWRKSENGNLVWIETKSMVEDLIFEAVAEQLEQA